MDEFGLQPKYIMLHYSYGVAIGYVAPRALPWFKSQSNVAIDYVAPRALPWFINVAIDYAARGFPQV